ncbi:MAG TPA: hypothetical protein PLS94_08875 [Prolixibacteraceae bacterium]|nr:hypothetical protein [Prolixibacteraceae bacterium]
MKLQLGKYFLDWKELFRPGAFKYFDSFVDFQIEKVFENTASNEKALFLSELCRLAYIKDNHLRAEVLNTYGMVEDFSFSRKGCQLYGLSFTDATVQQKIICFRGTDDVFDYKHIFTLGKSKFSKGGEVYRGFYSSFLNIEETIEKLSSQYSNSKVWLVGHSLGGVLALMSACYFKNPELNVFGIPKVGDCRFNENLMEMVINYYHLDGDFIEYLPFDKSFEKLNCQLIPSVKLNNRSCPTLLYSHAPIAYSLNISLRV